jgi:hypothetical protein
MMNAERRINRAANLRIDPPRQYRLPTWTSGLIQHSSFIVHHCGAADD